MKNNDLYDLIKTLTASEKKVFKEKYSGKEDGNFVRLFNAIVTGETLNDAQVKKKFAKEIFIKHLHKTKSYLYHAILETLHAHIQDSYSRLQIFHQLELAETLFSRKLLPQAEEALEEALKAAQETEEVDLEQFIRAQLIGLNTVLQRSQKELKAVPIYQKKAQQFTSYQMLFFTVFDSYTERGKKGGDTLELHRTNPLVTNPPKFLSKGAERYFEITQSLLFTEARNYHSANISNSKLADLTEPLAFVSPRSETAYVNALFNAALSMQGIEKDNSKIIQRLEKFEPIGRWAQSHRFVCLLRLKLSRYASGKRTAEGKKLLTWIEGELPQHNSELTEPELVKLHITIAGLCLKELEYSRTLDYLLLINHSKAARENRPVIYRVAMLYQLIAHYEMGNFDWLSTTLRNYKYFQKTNDSFYLIEKHTLSFLNKALQLSNKNERNEAKKKFEKELYKAAGKEQKTGMAYLENIDWVKAG